MTYALSLCRHVAILLVLLITFSSSAFATSEKDISLLAQQDPVPGKAHLYILKRSNLLFQDIALTLSIGKYDLDNISTSEYYLIEMWPGTYTVYVNNFYPADRKYYLKSNRNISLKAGDSVVFGINPKHESTYYFKSEVEKSIARRELKQFIPATEIPGATLRGYNQSNKWMGPNKNGIADGVGSAQFSNGLAYIGRVDYGDLTTEGRLQYPNGDFYKGEYIGAEPYGKGMLSDKDGNVIFSGDFRDGSPFNGLSNVGGKVINKYNYGRAVETNPEILAQKKIDEDDKKEIAKVVQTATKVKTSISIIESEKDDAQVKFNKQELEFPKQCHCTFNFCLDSYNSEDTYEERQATKRLWAARDQACREWRSSGGSLAARQAQLDSKLAKADEKLASLNQEFEQAKERDQLARQQKLTELASSRAERVAAHQKKIEQEQAENLRKNKEACVGRETYCGCAVYLQPEQVKKMATCEK